MGKELQKTACGVILFDRQYWKLRIICECPLCTHIRQVSDPFEHGLLVFSKVCFLIFVSLKYVFMSFVMCYVCCAHTRGELLNTFSISFFRMENCTISDKGCAALASALQFNPSHLRELNLNFNVLGSSGLKLLSGLLKDSHCKLEKLQ